MQVKAFPRARRDRWQAGFTMIEVLVALTILAIALAASLRAVGNLAVEGAELHERMLAAFSADNALIDVRLAHEWLPTGSSTFACPQGNLAFECQRTVSNTPNPVFRRVEVTVKNPAHGGNLAHLVTVIANETNRPL